MVAFGSVTLALGRATSYEVGEGGSDCQALAGGVEGGEGKRPGGFRELTANGGRTTIGSWKVLLLVICYKPKVFVPTA
jgi:hypothetical protein